MQGARIPLREFYGGGPETDREIASVNGDRSCLRQRKPAAHGMDDARRPPACGDQAWSKSRARTGSHGFPDRIGQFTRDATAAPKRCLFKRVQLNQYGPESLPERGNA